MHKPRPDAQPYCCLEIADWIVQSPNIAYFYCKICKNEVVTEHSSKKREKYEVTLDTNKVSRRVR